VSEELNKQLSDLASKLGVTVEHLWSVLVRQAYIDGISSLTTVISCVLLGVVVLWAFFYLRRKFKPAIEPKEHFILTTEPVQYMVLAIVLAVLLAVACNNFYWVISDFFSPEFYAWRQLPGVR